jgi:glycosyltransferase involved in cell wall biosynthesis
MEDVMASVLVVRAGNVASSRHVVTLMNFLAASGFKVMAVTLEGGSEPVPGLSAGIEVEGLGCSRGSGFGKIVSRGTAAMRLNRALRARRVDVLYVIDSWTLPVVWLATGGRMRWRGSKLVYHTYDWLEPSLHKGAHLRLEKTACRRADLVVNTDRSRARLQRTLYRLTRTPLWVQNAMPRATPPPVQDPLLRRELLGGQDRPNACIVVYPTAVWDEGSAQRLTFELIAAVAELPERYRLATFFREGSEYERCKALVASRRLDRRVTFLPVVPFDRLLLLLGSADVGAILYDDRVSSGYFMANADKLSLLIACGLPYVASDYPNLEAVTYKHGLGVCCDARDPSGLADAILQLVEGPVALSDRKSRVREVFEHELYFERDGEKLAVALRDMFEAHSV